MKAKKIKKLLISLFMGMAGAIVVCAYAGSHPSLPKSKIVRIVSQIGMCSGEQVRAPSGQDYILTAGHCRKLSSSDNMFTIKTEDGKSIERKLIQEDPNSDLMLIEGLPGLEGLHIAPSSYAGEHITTLTHGDNLDTYATKGDLIQMQKLTVPVSEITSDEDRAKCSYMPKNTVLSSPFGGQYCCLNIFEVISTAIIVPGSSGGAILDSHMNLVGVASAGDGTFSSFVSLKDIKEFLGNY